MFKVAVLVLALAAIALGETSSAPIPGFRPPSVPLSELAKSAHPVDVAPCSCFLAVHERLVKCQQSD